MKLELTQGWEFRVLDADKIQKIKIGNTYNVTLIDKDKKEYSVTVKLEK